MIDLALRAGPVESVAASSDEPQASRAPLADLRLLLCMTRGMSLRGWSRHGVLRRELALYRALHDLGAQITILSYGDETDSRHLSIPGAAVLTNRWRLSSTLYSVVAPWLHRRALRGVRVIKTNQLNGAWTGAIAKRVLGAKLIVRCGYVWSVLCESEPAWKRAVMRRLERFACRAADRLIVATDADRDQLIRAHALDADRITVVPNAVDTQMFQPMRHIVPEPGRLIFVGRLEPQKRPDLLLDAMAELPGARLTIVGDGSLRAALERRAVAQRLPIEFLGAVPHDRLPELLNRSQLFVLPSRIEGHPKALLEAMACGLTAIGCDVPGIREAIDHGRTGWLCTPTATGLRAAIDTLLADAPLRRRLGDAARDGVQSDCALESMLAREVAVLHAL